MERLDRDPKPWHRLISSYTNTPHYSLATCGLTIGQGKPSNTIAMTISPQCRKSKANVQSSSCMLAFVLREMIIGSSTASRAYTHAPRSECTSDPLTIRTRGPGAHHLPCPDPDAVHAWPFPTNLVRGPNVSHIHTSAHDMMYASHSNAHSQKEDDRAALMCCAA